MTTSGTTSRRCSEVDPFLRRFRTFGAILFGLACQFVEAEAPALSGDELGEKDDILLRREVDQGQQFDRGISNGGNHSRLSVWTGEEHHPCPDGSDRGRWGEEAYESSACSRLRMTCWTPPH